MGKIQELQLQLALVSDELINTQAELDNERQYQVTMEYLWALERELLSNLKEYSEKVKHQRDEAINQLDGAKHSISVLEKRVLQTTKQRDASLILNKFYKEDRKQRDKLLEAGEARIEELVKERDDIREAALLEAADVAQRGAATFDVRMRNSKNWNEKRDWQSMLFAAVDIKHAILALIGEKK